MPGCLVLCFFAVIFMDLVNSLKKSCNFKFGPNLDGDWSPLIFFLTFSNQLRFSYNCTAFSFIYQSYRMLGFLIVWCLVVKFRELINRRKRLHQIQKHACLYLLKRTIISFSKSRTDNSYLN